MEWNVETYRNELKIVFLAVQVEYQTVTRYNKHVNWQLRNAQKNVCTSQMDKNNFT